MYKKQRKLFLIEVGGGEHKKYVDRDKNNAEIRIRKKISTSLMSFSNPQKSQEVRSQLSQPAR